ncbi:glycosyltransferase [Lactobacillus johnsonii]|uniref:glycosyltransferase n=1 Tax=Lactobacillus johnsonii TaxID=33959 RepID=UPI0017840F6B|nr:glycosyltransferase [Lactobacillus johnsonii]QXL47009.1 glycosyltransferase [Lactobacillus johnsonii]
MKILEVCTIDFGLNGIPAHIRNYYNSLKKENHVDIVAPNFNKKMLKTMPLENYTRLYSINRRENPIKYIVLLRKLVLKNKYDIIHVHGNSGTMGLEVLACKNSGAKIFVHTHNTKWSAKILSFLLKNFMIKNADMLCAASEEAGHKLYGNRNFVIINNGIETENFKFNSKSRKGIRNKFNISDDVILLGHVGRFNYQKNQDFLIEIAKKIKFKNKDKYHFMLIGEDDKTKFIEKLQLENVEDMFTVLDATDRINEFYSAFDIFLFPSLFEGLGMAAIEAQYAGLKTIVSNKVPQAVRVTNSITFLPLNIDKWVKEIKKESDIERNTKIISSKYDIKTCSKKLMYLYTKACNIKTKKDV